jgi:hypothetical protein
LLVLCAVRQTSTGIAITKHAVNIALKRFSFYKNKLISSVPHGGQGLSESSLGGGDASGIIRIEAG